MNFNKIASSLLLSTLIALPAMAEETAPVTAGSGPNPFSDCGIGAALFDNDVAAAISNIIWDIGTTALTSATASPETCNGKDAVAAEFIFESFDNLVEESAQGEGDHISALMNILEISAEKQDQVISSVRLDLATLVTSPNYSTQTATQRAQAYYNSVMNAVNTAA